MTSSSKVYTEEGACMCDPLGRSREGNGKVPCCPRVHGYCSHHPVRFKNDIFMLPLNGNKAEYNLCLLLSLRNNVLDSFSRSGHKVHLILAGCFSVAS